MLMILLSFLKVISHLICGYNLNWISSELAYDLQKSVDWVKKWSIDFNAVKTQLVSFDRSNNNGSIDVKMDGSFLEEKSSFKMLVLIFSPKLDWDSYLSILLKLSLRKLEL